MGSSDRRKFIDSWKMDEVKIEDIPTPPPPKQKKKSQVLTEDPTTWLSLVIAVITLTTPALSSQPRVVCYYTNWSVYRPGTARFNPQNINPYLCTHLVYAFGGFTKDNTLKPFDKYQDIEKGGYAKFTGLKTYNKNLKTMLAIGGWNEGSSRFSPMVASRERRKEFVRNAIKFLRQNHFDGLDLDWEYPAFRDGGKPKDREHYAKLVRELREEFERESEKTGKPRLLLTMAVPAGIEYIQKGFDVKTLNKYLDWMNLLTYDFHSAFEPAVNHHAPLYPLEEPNEYSVDNELNIDYTIKFYLENGADRDKLVLGIPTYGRSYTLFNKDAVEIGAPADGPGEQGDATREKGYLAYYEICESLKPKQKKRAIDEDDSEEEEDSSEEEVDEPWTVVQPNPSAVGPYAYRGNQWVGYDDIDIVKKKAEYVAENGLGGIMFWSIDNDDFRGTCHGKPYPLIEAAKEAYIVKLGSTDNVIVTERSRAASTVRSTSNRRRNRPRSSTTTTTERPSKSSNKRKSASSTASTTPTWNIVTPEPPTTPDPGSDFKCTDEGFFPHPRDCKKYFWCLDSGPSNLGIVAHQFTCPSGLFFNKAADSCDFARNVLCKMPSATTKAPNTKAVTTTTTTSTTTRKPVKLSTKSSALFRTTTTTSTTPEPEVDEEYDEEPEDSADVDAEDPKVIKELIDLIRKVGGVEQLEKQLGLSESSSTDGAITTTPASIAINKRLYQKVLERTRGKNNKLNGNSGPDGGSPLTALYSRRGPQNAGLEQTAEKDKLLKKDRPQYTTINRSRPSTSTQQPEVEEEDDDLEDIPVSAPRQAQSRLVEESRAGTTAKPLQYVNIRRARPLSTSDTADDSASRNALFERAETFVTVTETPNSLDIASARRENIPEYVTIRRQRPTTEEATTEQFQNTEAEEPQETALEKEISSPQQSSQPQYTSIVRVRSTTTTIAPEENSPEPTTVLAVQIASLLNSHSAEVNSEEDTKTTIEAATVTIPTTTPTTTTTTRAPSSAPTRRTILRRRGTTTTTQATPSSSTQAPKRSFPRRTKATAAPDLENPDVDTTTSKYKRTNFKSRTTTDKPDPASKSPEGAKVDIPGKEENGGKRAKRPSLNSSGARNERPTRNFVRRRLGGANVTTSTTTPSPSSSSVASRRPLRVSSRRRPQSSTTVTTTTSTTETPTTVLLASEEYLQDIGDTDFIEDPTPEERPITNLTKTRRPLLLKDEPDQNPSATNEDERKRHSKKYSSSFKQNQLDEVLKKREKERSSEEEATTEGVPRTTADDNDAETALAIAAHQLLSAPLPSIPNYDEPKPTKKQSRPPTTIHQYDYTSPTYADEYTTRNTYDYSSTPIYKIGNDYVQTTTGTLYDITTGFNNAKTTYTPKTTTYTTSPFTSRVSRPAAFTTANILSTLSKDPTTEFSRVQTPTANPGYSRNTESRGFTRASTSTLSAGYNGPSSIGPSTARYVGTTDKLIPVPVEVFTTGGYSSISQEPSYFTREYLLESPVTKTYDEEYQYLSPTTPQTSTRKVNKKITYRRISTTIPPTIRSYVPEVTSPTPRRVPNRKPFEKIPLDKEIRPKYKPVENYDYYDDGAEHLASKYGEGTKVVLHSKGTIECLDIGNFPHPASCKKFISCARLENSSLLGWEYICPQGLSFDPVGGICNWSAGLGCSEKDV